jgi:hypothetical protein
MSTAIKKRRRSRSLVGLALLAALTAAMLLGANRLSRTLFERPPGAPREASPAALATRARPPNADAADDASLFRVVGCDGAVEAFRDGRWTPIQRGELLTPQDVLRTAPGARAVLRLGATSEIELREKVEIKLERLSGAGAIIDLRRGKVEARVARAGDNITISASETRISNEGPARYIVMADESNGRVSVAAVEGAARFAAGGKEIVVPQGTESRSERGGVPADPEKIPEDVLLTVVWPETERHELRAKAGAGAGGGATINVGGAGGTTVSGRVHPSSTVMINGAATIVAADGRFTADLPLREGHNEVRVETEDLMGRKRSKETILVRSPPHPPELTPLPNKLWTQ